MLLLVEVSKAVDTRECGRMVLAQRLLTAIKRPSVHLLGLFVLALVLQH
jgi:hypothetical protein